VAGASSPVPQATSVVLAIPAARVDRRRRSVWDILYLFEVMRSDGVTSKCVDESRLEF
jgi:DNA invertase Pin-like site-specific DNA recombinase